MNKGINEYEKFKVLRPLFGNVKYDENGMPIMKKVNEKEFNFEKAIPLNLQNLTKNINGKNVLVFPFNDDKVLEKYWNDPLKYIPLFQTTMGIGTPDYSVLPNMNINLIKTNIFRNRWLGCTMQYYGINAIPTIGWVYRDTYDICFSGIEPGGVIMISTIGCQDEKQLFLQGFNEMKRRLTPSLIIVYGDMIRGMTGRFINYVYSDCFNKNTNNIIEQDKLFNLSPIFTIKEAGVYGF